MRSIWKGAISFGLVNVPVRLYSATEDHDLSLHQVHDADGGRIRYQRRCEVCGKVVDYAHIDKAYDDGNTTVVLTEDDLKSLPEERSREIEVVEFVPSAQVDPIMFDRSYFLEPDKTAVKAYALLRRALADTDRTAIVQFSLRQKTRLGALRVRDKVLMLQSLLWDDEVREADFPSLDEDVRVSAKEARDGVLAGGEHERGLRAGEVLRRLPGAAARAHRGEAGTGRRVGHGRDVRRGGRRRTRGRPGRRPDGRAAPQCRGEPVEAEVGPRRRSPPSAKKSSPAKKSSTKKKARQEAAKKSAAKKSAAKKSA